MKLKNKDGELFDLSPDTLIEIERTNPFFIEWGEQSLPLSLPPTDKNKRLLGQIQNIASRGRAEKVEVYLHEQVFNMKAQMVLLSYNDKDGFECSLLLNEGSLNNRVQDLDIADVFGDETLKFVSVNACVDFLRTLMKTDNERFAIFRIVALPEDKGKFRHLNLMDKKQADGYYDFTNRNETVETSGENTINIPAGCYISPFVKLNYLLKRIFGHLGYTYEPGFLGSVPFSNMVVLNNTADTIVKGSIKMTDILPDCSVGTLLDVLRKKFCMEFAVDDVKRIVSVVLFNEIVDSISSKDLTGVLAGKPSITYPESYKQLKLHTDYVQHVLCSLSFSLVGENITIEADQSDYLSLKNLYPDALFDRNSGTIYRLGVKGHAAVIEGIGTMATDYYTGGSLSTEEITCDECMPGMVCSKTSFGTTFWPPAPVVEKYRFLHTKVIMDSEKDSAGDTQENEGKMDVSDTDELPVMLAFAGRISGMGYDFGTISNYYDDNKQWDYALYWNGPDGLFEKFWRKRDDLLRNSLHKISVDLLLSEADKMQLSSTSKITVQGQELIPETIRYVVGENNLSTSDFYTISKHEPISSAPKQTWPAVSDYYWELKSKTNPNRRYVEYNAEPETIYYAPPTAVEYAAGGEYHHVTYNVKLGNSKDENGKITDPVEGTVTVWLVPHRMGDIW